MNKKTIVALSIVSILLSGCGQEEETFHEPSLALAVTHPIKQDNTIVKEYVSQIRAIQHIEVRAMEKGYLQQTFVDEGQTVEQIGRASCRERV